MNKLEKTITLFYRRQSRNFYKFSAQDKDLIVTVYIDKEHFELPPQEISVSVNAEKKVIESE